MADEVDIATDQAELFLASAINAARAPVLPPLAECDACLNCEAELPAGVRRFCDADCAADWQHRQDVWRKQGLGA